MSSVLFPLRGSAAWFRDRSSISNLESEIKQALFCYDNLYFQDGIYDLHITENGAIESPTPLGPGAPRELRFGRGEPIMFGIGEEDDEEVTPIVFGDTRESYHVDFTPVLASIGIQNVEGIHVWDMDLSEMGRRIAQETAQADLENRELLISLPVEPLERNYVVKAFHSDFLLAAVSGMDVVADRRISAAATARQRNISPRALPAVPSVFYKSTLRFRLPDVRSLTWEEVFELRESLPGVSFRQMLNDVRHNLEEELPNIHTQRDLELFVSEAVNHELTDHIQEVAPNVQSSLLGIALNAVPHLGPVLSGLKDVAVIMRHKRSWISLLR